MTSIRWIVLAASAALAYGLTVGVISAQGHPVTGAVDGKQLFLDNKCNTCHTLKSAGVVKRVAAAGDPTEAKAAKEKTPPDLSSIGLTRKADWMGKYLMKTEAIKGEKHSRKFRGSEAELKLVAAWLEAQKAPKAK